MAIETPPALPEPLPADPPIRGQRATFSARMDAFVTWLFTAVAWFVSLATNVFNNATEAFNLADAANTSRNQALEYRNTASAHKDAAAASALAASASANLNGTSTTVRTPAVGSMTWAYADATGKLPLVGARGRSVSRANPTTNFALWTVTGWASPTLTVTVDDIGPGPLSASDWNIVFESEPGPPGEDAQYGMPFGADATGTLALTYSDSGGAHRLTGDTAITVDDPADLTNGWTHFIEALAGVGTVTADFSDGAASKTIPRGCCALLACDGGELTLAVFSRSPATLGSPSTAAVINSYASDGCLAACALTSTHSMVVLRTASNTARVAMIDFTTAPPTIGAMETITTDLGTGRAHIARVTDNQALVVFRESGSLRALAVDRTGNTITTPLNAETEVHASGLSPALCAVTATKFACAYVRGTYYTCIKTIDVTGSAVAANTEYIVRDDTGGTYSQYVFAVSAVSASKVLLSYSNTVGEYLAGLALSGDTFSASHELGRGASNAQNHGVAHAVMPDGRVAVISGSSHSTGAGMTHSVRAFTADWSGIKIVLSPITSVGDAYMGLLQAALLSSGYIVLIGREALGSGGYSASVLERVDDIIKLVSGRGIKAAVSGSAYIGGVFQVSGARLAVVYQNLENSSYPEVLTIPLNTAA